MYWNTVNENLRSVLRDIMHEPKFDAFRLVGGTALSLQWGHRMNGTFLFLIIHRLQRDLLCLSALAVRP